MGCFVRALHAFFCFHTDYTVWICVSGFGYKSAFKAYHCRYLGSDNLLM